MDQIKCNWFDAPKQSRRDRIMPKLNIPCGMQFMGYRNTEEITHGRK